MTAKNKSAGKKRRSRVKRPALQKKYNSRIKQEYLDFDYLNKLSETELDWLHKFADEEINARFENDGTDFNQTKAERKIVYDRNNARNRDLYGHVRNKVGNTKIITVDQHENLIENELAGDVNGHYVEDAMIEYIDHLESSKKLDDSDDDTSQRD